MRGILDKKDEEKQRKKNNMIIGIILIVLMGASVIGYSFFSSDSFEESTRETIEYRGLEFVDSGYGTWVFEIQGFQFQTRYLPIDTLNISTIMTKTIQNYQNQVLYFVNQDDLSQNGISEIGSNLNNFIQRINFACLENEKCEGDLPIKNCTSDNVIVFKKDNIPRINEQEKCVYIYTSEEEILRASDTFLYKILGI
jgi:flagellar basal body-associated protein FliL